MRPLLRVLVVDDDAGTAELLRVVLEEAGFEVAVAMDERRLPDGPFACVVTDLMRVSSYSLEDARGVVLRLADRYPSVPVILVTGHSEAFRQAAALGVHTAIMKPFDVDVVVGAVRQATTE